MPHARPEVLLVKRNYLKVYTESENTLALSRPVVNTRYVSGA